MLLLICTLLVSPAPEAAAASSQDNKSFSNVRYIRNYDGDTITFDIPEASTIVGKNMAIRIHGIDAPELKRSKCQTEREMALQAKNRVHSLLRAASEINLHRVQRGKYFRFLADVEFDGKDLGSLLLQEKLAIAYFGGTKNYDWCKEDYSTHVPKRRLPAVTPPLIDGIYVWPPPPAQPER